MVEVPIEIHRGDAPHDNLANAALAYDPILDAHPHHNPPAQAGNIVLKINPQGHILENILSLIFHLVDGYDNSSIFSTAAAQIIAYKTTNASKDSQYNEGVAIALVIMISFRMLGTAIMAANSLMIEHEQQKGEAKRKKTLHRLMELKLSLLDNYITLTADEHGEYSRLLDAEFRTHKLRQLRAHRRVLDAYLMKLVPAPVEAEVNAGQVPPIPVEAEVNAEQVALIPMEAGFNAEQVALIPAEAGVNVEQVPLLPVEAADNEQPLAPIVVANQNDYVIPKGETAWSVANSLTFSLALATYRDKFHLLTPYDKHLLYTTLGQITNSYKDVPEAQAFGHSNLAAREFNIFITTQNEEERRNAERNILAIIENTLKDRVTIKRPTFRVRVAKKIGDFLRSNGAAISAMTAAAGLIALIPGANAIMMGVYISAIAVGVSFASLKVCWDIYQEHKYHKNRKTYDNETRRAKQALAVETLLINAQTLAQSPEVKQVLDQNEAQEVVDYNDELYNETLSKVSDAKAKSTATKIITVAGVLGSATLIGWNTVVSFSALTTGIGGQVGLSIAGLVGASAIAVPIVGAVIAAGFFVFKTALDLIQDHKEEQAKLTQVISNLIFQKQRAQMADSKALRDVCVLSRSELLRRYIAEYLSTQTDKLNNNVYNIYDNQDLVQAKAKARTEFFQRIEKLVGEEKAEAEKPEYYYGYLADFMCKGIEDPHEKEAIIDLVTRLKYHMPEQDYIAPSIDAPITFSHVTEEVIPCAELRKKPAIFRRKPDGKIDHAGNWDRLSEKFLSASGTYSVASKVATTAGIGIALAMTFASGPAFFIVAGILVGTFVGIAITREVLSHYRNKRMAEYDQTLAHIEMRDKTAEYYLATQQKTTQRAEAEKENLNAPVFVNGLQNQAQAQPASRQAHARRPLNPVDQNRAVAATPLAPQQLPAAAPPQLLPTANAPISAKKDSTASQINFGGLINNNVSNSKSSPEMPSEYQPLMTHHDSDSDSEEPGHNLDLL